VSENRFHARQAATALLKIAKTTSDREISAGAVRASADPKDQVGELPHEVSVKPPDVQTDELCHCQPSIVASDRHGAFNQTR
jgi:hypothetical protein